MLRWAEARERVLVVKGKPARQKVEVKPVPKLAEFSNRFLEGYAKANRHKPSGISSKESILRVHLVPMIGDKPLKEITTEDSSAGEVSAHRMFAQNGQQCWRFERCAEDS